jgi:Tfp pilus assembly PilM family ATPase
MQHLVLNRSTEVWRDELLDEIYAAEHATGYESVCPSEYDEIVHSFRHDVIDEINIDIEIHWTSTQRVGVGVIVQSGSASAIEEIEAAIEHLAPEYRDAFVERCRELKSVTEEA